MTRTDLDESTTLLGVLLDALLAGLRGHSGRARARVIFAIGSLRGNAGTLVQTAKLGAAFLNCFDLARAAAMTRIAFDAVRLAMLAQAPKSIPAVAIANAGILFALFEESRILA